MLLEEGRILTVQKHIHIIIDLLLALEYYNLYTLLKKWIDVSNTETRQSTLVNGRVPSASEYINKK